MGLGMPARWAIVAVALVILFSVAESALQISDERAGSGPVFARPQGVVLHIGLLCLWIGVENGPR